MKIQSKAIKTKKESNPKQTHSCLSYQAKKVVITNKDYQINCVCDQEIGSKQNHNKVGIQK